MSPGSIDRASFLAPKREGLPDRPTLTSRATLNWIAVGAASDANLNDPAAIARVWVFPPEGDGLSNAMLVMLRVMAEGGSAWPLQEEVPNFTLPSPARFAAIRARAQGLIDSTGMDAATLVERLEGELFVFGLRRMLLAGAELSLIQAALQQRLRVLAEPAIGEDPRALTSTGMAIEVPHAVFATAHLRIDPDADAIYGLGAGGYLRPRFLTSEVGAIWPPMEGVEPVSVDTTPLRSGLPGRPTSRHLIETEFLRRAQAGEVNRNSVMDEARILSTWLHERHPHHPPASAGTVANNLRNRYRALFSPTKSSSHP
ncbi:hypothetical protein VQH23_04000 [Pararoseomonas sp. SCSIO 73927]|uniref:hypothetical protein n=1 Tax=Pararoseomonas sp. SCSIO 73927 TaxID=3114537 RepID=UPI0030D52495